jgi:hypothetical protein
MIQARETTPARAWRHYNIVYGALVGRHSVCVRDDVAPAPARREENMDNP